LYTLSGIDNSILANFIDIKKREDIPGYAVLIGSVGGHIECKDTTNF